MYNSLVLSHLSYGVILWGWQCQNICVTKESREVFFTNSKYNCHTSGLFKKLKLRKFFDVCALHDLILCHKQFNNVLPSYLIDLLPVYRDDPHNYETRLKNQLRPPPISHEFARLSI